MSKVEEKQDSAEETRLSAPAYWKRPRKEHNGTPAASFVGSILVKVPSCRVEGCHAALLNAKDFYRKYRVCEMHSKAPNVIVRGLVQRFCQKCTRFHVVSEFDDEKRSCRSCRRTLAERRERRRKSSQDSVSRNASESSTILPDPPAPNSNPDLGTLLDTPQPKIDVDENLNLPWTLNQKKNPNARRLQYKPGKVSLVIWLHGASTSSG